VPLLFPAGVPLKWHFSSLENHPRKIPATDPGKNLSEDLLLTWITQLLSWIPARILVGIKSW